MTGNTKPTRTECTEKDIWLFSTGNIANCLIFNMVGLYIMYYYTNILGVSAAVAGTIFMVARLVDAFTDPLMGMIVDQQLKVLMQIIARCHIILDLNLPCQHLLR